MKRVKMKKAFTIVEVILVLSISSLFAIGMMAGWSINIERQRYDDTVNTLKSDIQGIFNEVENPTNARGSISCVNDGGDVRIQSSAVDSSRGASNCILLGKLVSMADGTIGGGNIWGHNRISVVDIVGRDIDVSTACSGPCQNHFDAIRATGFVFDFNGLTRRDIVPQWGGEYKLITDNRGGVIFPRGKTGLSGVGQVSSFVVIRSPLDNTLLTLAYPSVALTDNRVGTTTSGVSFSMNNIRDDLARPQMILNESRKIEICVRNPGINRAIAGESFFGRNKVIRIGGSSAAVEIAPLDGEGSVSCGNGMGFDDVIRG